MSTIVNNSTHCTSTYICIACLITISVLNFPMVIIFFFYKVLSALVESILLTYQIAFIFCNWTLDIWNIINLLYLAQHKALPELMRNWWPKPSLGNYHTSYQLENQQNMTEKPKWLHKSYYKIKKNQVLNKGYPDSCLDGQPPDIPWPDELWIGGKNSHSWYCSQINYHISARKKNV